MYFSCYSVCKSFVSKLQSFIESSNCTLWGRRISVLYCSRLCSFYLKRSPLYWNRSWKFYLHAKPDCGDPQHRGHNKISERGHIGNFLLKLRADFVYKTNISNCNFASWNITTVFNFDFWKCVPSVLQVDIYICSQSEREILILPNPKSAEN